MAMCRRLTSSSRPPSRDRSASCTHLTLSRLYDESGSEKCSMCYRSPGLGWLYRCTQDHDGFLPASDFCQVDNTKRLEHDAHLYTLSSSISEAAAKGHYTDRELDILWKQKIEVRKLIRQIIPSTSSSASSASSSNYSIAATNTCSTLPSIDSDTDPEPDISHPTDFLQTCRGPLEPIQEVHDDLEKDHKILPFAKTSVTSMCSFRVCHNCRPNYRERAWLSLDGVMKTPYRQLVPPRHEIQNRRVSDVDLLKNLSTAVGSPGSENSMRGLFAAPVKRNSRTEFQDTVQRLLRNRDPDGCYHSTSIGLSHEQSHDLTYLSTDQSFAAVATSSKDKLEIIPTPSSDRSASFDNDNTILPSVLQPSAIADDRTPISSLLGPRPLYHRRGFERIASIEVPSRLAVSHCGESTSSPGPSTSQSVSSCPGIVERGSLVENAKNVLRDSKENIDNSRSLSNTVNMSDDEVHLPHEMSIESMNGSILGFKKTPKANSRFLID